MTTNRATRRAASAGNAQTGDHANQTFPVLALGKGFTFEIGFNTLVDMEAELGVNWLKGADSLTERLSLPLFRSMFAMGLREHHPDITEIEAGRIMGAIGVKEAMALVLKGVSSATGGDPDAVDEQVSNAVGTTIS